VAVALVSVSVAGAIAIAVPSDAGAPTSGAKLAEDAFQPVGPPGVDGRSESRALGAVSDQPIPTETPTPTPTPTLTAAPTPTPEPATVIRFRPRDGWTDVSRSADVSVRFSVPMDRSVSQGAFQATIGDTPIAGQFRWAEGDTVLVLSPSTALPYGATVVLSVNASARSADGAPLQAPAQVSFVVVAKPPPPAPKPTPKPSVWQWPLIGPITQRFGESLTQYGVHQGIDINGETGDKVRAARSGRVIVAGYADECGGLQVRIDHGGDVTSWYRHLSSVSVGVGDRVDVGALIGRVGSTGCSTGSHLHFGIRIGSTFVDPLKYLPPR
jgi:murein DD-endopeptidase MepM/ murein hydrolase activator NlpD